MTRPSDDPSPVPGISSAPLAGFDSEANLAMSDVEAVLVQQMKMMQSVMGETQKALLLAGKRNRSFAALKEENRQLTQQLVEAGLDPETAHASAGADFDGRGSDEPMISGTYQAWCQLPSPPGTLEDGSMERKSAQSRPSPPNPKLAPILPEEADRPVKMDSGTISQGSKKPDSRNKLNANEGSEGQRRFSGSRAIDHDNDNDKEKSSVPKGPQAVFADAAALKEKLRMNMAKPPYDVRNFYWETGLAQKVARSHWFDNVTLSVIAFNALWIAIDTDYNRAEILLEAHPVFIVMENFFCTYFFLEWSFRFFAFQNKRNCGKDGWFIFDSILVFMMVGETWIMTCIMAFAGGGSSALGNASILRLFRLMRLSRMARMARLLRAMPELMVLIKGMAVAMRSVVFTFVLLAGFIYVYGIAFVQLMREDYPAGADYFPSVPAAMKTLLLRGVLPDEMELIETVGDDGWVFALMIMTYVILAGLCIMNMLVGVLCEVVSVVSAVEKESMLVNYVKGTLQHMLQTSGIDVDGDHHIAKHEFENLLMVPGAAKAIQDVGVDVVGLMDFTDFIFQDGKELSFPEFMDTVLQLRGTNTATVKDLVDLRKLLVQEIDKLQSGIVDVVADHIRQSLLFAGMGSMGGMPPGFPSSMPMPMSMPTTTLTPMLTPSNLGQIVSIDNKGVAIKGTMSWAASAASRLSAAASELSAAAGELSSRSPSNKKAEKASTESSPAPLPNIEYLKLEDANEPPSPK